MARARRPTRPDQPAAPAPPVTPEAPRPGRLRGSLLEFLLLVGLTAALLFGITRAALGVYFKTAAIRPGVRFLGMEVGGLGPVAAQERMEGLVESCFRFPLLLDLEDTTYFLYLRDHFQLEVDYDGLIAQARALDAGQDLWDRAWRHLLGDFRPVELPWEPKLDLEFTREALTKLLEDRTESRMHASHQPDGMLRVVVSNPSDQVEAILTELERVVRESPLPSRRVLRPPPVAAGDVEYQVHPDDPTQGFRFPVAHAQVSLAGADEVELANVARGLERLHDRILNPGEQLHFTRAIGPLTLEQGYLGRLPAPVSPDLPSMGLAAPWPEEGAGEVPDAPEPSLASTAPMQIGTGVERLASATFQALVRAGADLVARDTHLHHTQDLRYAPLGLDVRILSAPGEPPGELILQNPWDFPLRLLGSMTVEAVRLDVTALAEPPVDIEVRVGVPEKVPYKTELIRDPETPRGQERVEREGVDGFRVKIFRKRIRKDGLPPKEGMLGEPIDYRPIPGRIVLGTGDPEAIRRRELEERHRRMLRWMDGGASGESGGDAPAPDLALPPGW